MGFNKATQEKIDVAKNNRFDENGKPKILTYLFGNDKEGSRSFR